MLSAHLSARSLSLKRGPLDSTWTTEGRFFSPLHFSTYHPRCYLHRGHCNRAEAKALNARGHRCKSRKRPLSSLRHHLVTRHVSDNSPPVPAAPPTPGTVSLTGFTTSFVPSAPPPPPPPRPVPVTCHSSYVVEERFLLPSFLVLTPGGRVSSLPGKSFFAT